MEKNSASWLPLLSTFLGGLLAILGGTIASTHQAKLANSVEQERLVREKLEQAYLLLLQAEDWALAELQVAGPVAAPSAKEPHDPTREALMLIRLYSPELKEQANELEKVHRDFHAKVVEYSQLSGFAPAADEIGPPTASDYLSDSLSAFRDKLEQTLRGLEELAQDRIHRSVGG